MSTLYSIGAMNQLGDAFEGAGFTAEDVTKLKQFKGLGKIKDVLCGKALIAYSSHVIDTDAIPLVPPGYSIKKHIGHGSWEWDSSVIDFFLSKEQEKKYQKGYKLKEVIEVIDNKKILNANVLDYLLLHPELIPESWKDQLTCFWGTIYCVSADDLYVRYLGWNGSNWFSRCSWLGDNFNLKHPAILAS